MSVLWWGSEAQREAAEASLQAQHDSVRMHRRECMRLIAVQGRFGDRPLHTKLKPLGTFYLAEDYHQVTVLAIHWQALMSAELQGQEGLRQARAIHHLALLQCWQCCLQGTES